MIDTKNKAMWNDRAAKMAEMYPESVGFNWGEILRQDPMIMNRILIDAIKADDPEGKIKKKTPEENIEKYKRILDESYSDYDFFTTFAALTKGETVRKIAEKCGLDNMVVNRLQHKKIQPTIIIMEKISKGYNKPKGYFLEYRIASVLNKLGEYLLDAPEAATNMYVKLHG